MLNRTLQVLHALTAKMDLKDEQLVKTHLNSQEQQLFYAMDVNSQKHSVKVAYTCLKLAIAYSVVNLDILLRAALLHDIGKKKGDLTTVRRILIVLVNYLSPKLGELLATQGRLANRQNLNYAFYIYRAHPNIGHHKARAAGVEPAILELIAKHHLTYQPGEPLELTLLRKADSLN